MNGEFALASVTHERATDLHTLTAGDARGKHKRRSAPGESCMNRFSDAGSTPAVSSPEGRAANLGLSEVGNCSIPTTVEFVCCVGCSSPEGRAAKLGFSEVENCSIPTTVELVRCEGCSSCFRQSLKQKGRAAKLGLSEVENYRNPTTVAFYVVVGFLFLQNSPACLQNPPNVLY